MIVTSQKYQFISVKQTLQKYDAENHVKSPRNQDAVVALDEKAIDKMVAFWVKTLSHCWLMDGSSPKYGIDNRF